MEKLLFLEEKQSGDYVWEKTPLFLKNVLRNKRKMMLIIILVSFGMIVFNSILFILKCDNSIVYIDKAISVDYFLTACDTRETNMREPTEVVKESDILSVEKNKAFEDGGRLYHSIAPIAALDSDEVPETSSFSITYGMPLEKNEEGNYFLNLYGADDFVFKEMELYEGQIDLEKLATGNYIIYGLDRRAGSLAYVDDVSEDWKYFDVGDEITLFGGKGAKKYKIMAICKVNHTYAEQYEYSYPGHELIFYLPTGEYLEYAKSSDKGETAPMRYLFNTAGSKDISSNLNGIKYESRKEWYEKYKSDNDGILQAAFLFAMGCGFIGVFCYINTMIVSYLDRKKEFKVLENIGMSSKQLYSMIIGEGLTYGFIISLVIAIFVAAVEIIGKSLLVGESWKYVASINPLIACIVTIFVVSISVPLLIYFKIQHTNN